MVNYDNFAKTFSNSRKNLKWEELDYFLSSLDLDNKKILDVGCGNGRLLSNIKEKNINFSSYLGVDLSMGLLEEARQIHPKSSFLNLDMTSLDKLEDTYDIVFFIASFHHLDLLEARIDTLKKLKKSLADDAIICMTNWNLLGQEKYSSSKIQSSENEFDSRDYLIKIGDFDRYYHSFSLKELEYLFTTAGFRIIENRVFDNGRNIVSIIKK